MAKKNSSIKINKVSFYALIVLGAFYFSMMVIAAVDAYGYFQELIWMGMAGTLALLAFFAFIAWNYVAHKAVVYKILYLLLVAIMAVGIILPPCLLFA